MPCYHDPTPEQIAQWEADDRMRDAWTLHNSKPADLLCMVLKNATEAGLYPQILGSLPGPFHREKLDKWWREHQVRDEFKDNSKS